VHGLDLLSPEEILERLERVLAASPADATEIAWLETGRAGVSNRQRDPVPTPWRERTVLVRVAERGRAGFHRTGADSVGELESAVRQALGEARVGPPRAPRPLAEASAGEEETSDLFDPRLAGLDPEAARAWLAEGLEKDESATLDWSEARLVVTHSAGLRRTTRVTAATVAARCGRGAGAGRAAASARALGAPALAAALERARNRRAEPGVEDDGETGLETAAPGGGGAAHTADGGRVDDGGADADATEAPRDTPGETLPVVLAAEAAAALVELLARFALAPRPADLAPPLPDLQLDPALTLRDDPTDPEGLPLPFDLAGRAGRAVELLRDGRPAGAAAGGEAAPPSDGRDDGVRHLLLAAGDRGLGELLAAAEGGLWIAGLEAVECFDPGSLRFRARTVGTRQIAGGRLGAVEPPRLWEDRLDRALARLLGVGSERVTLALGGSVLGGVTAPALALAEAAGLR
jgi:predicted Zn-dependent protease